MNNENINNNTEQEQLISFKHAKRAKKYVLKSDRKVRTFKYSNNFLSALLSCFEQASQMRITSKTRMNEYTQSLIDVNNNGIDYDSIILKYEQQYITPYDANMAKFLDFEENVEKYL